MSFKEVMLMKSFSLFVASFPRREHYYPFCCNSLKIIIYGFVFETEQRELFFHSIYNRCSKIYKQFLSN